MVNNETINRSYMPALIGTALLLVLGYGIMYYVFYSDTIGAISLPYLEDFSDDSRVEYRQIGGNWVLENGQLIQQDTDLVDIVAVIPSLTVEPADSYQFGAHINVLEGPKGGGLVFNMQDRNTIVNSHLVRLGNNEETDYLIYGYFDGDRNFNTQGTFNPEGLDSDFTLGVIINDSSYIITLNDEAIAADVPLIHKGGSLALTTWNSKVAFDNVAVEQPSLPLPTVAETANTGEMADGETSVEGELSGVGTAEDGSAIVDGTEGPASVIVTADVPYFDSFVNDTEFRYEAFTGDWSIEDGAMVQNNAQLVDVVAAVPGIDLQENTQYEFNTDFRILDGPNGAGLVFNMQQPATVRGSHMLRLGNSSGNDYLIYGYFDDNRNFNPQGSKPVLGLESDANLGIVVYSDGYDIMLNGSPLVSAIPLVYHGGRLGVTTWNSRVAFDSVNINLFEGERVIGSTDEAIETDADTAPAVENLSSPWSENFDNAEDHSFIPVGGNWQLRDGTLTQLQTDVSDVMALVPGVSLSAAQTYNFSTQFDILEGPNGAGLMFNVQNDSTINESHIVRFGSNEGENYMIYGYFDADRSFNFQGSADPATLPDLSETITLGVAVDSETYAIEVNGEPIAGEIPLTYSGGRVALTTWNSSVAFDEVSVQASTAPAAEEAETATEPDAEASGETEAETITETTSETIAPADDFFTNPRPINSYFSTDLNADTSFTNWRTLNGDWEIQESGLVHPNDQWFDNLIVHANRYDQYTFTASFEMGEGVGGSGVAFNIPTADSIAGAHIARYLNDEAVSWGYFDNDGRYVEQGKTTIAAGDSNQHTIVITVDGETYSVELDGESLASGVSLFSTEGHVGFTTTQRIVTYGDLAVNQ